MNYCCLFVGVYQLLLLLDLCRCSQSPIQKSGALNNNNNNNNNNNRTKRDVVSVGPDVHSLQSTINDHRVIIEYLINNSINTSYLGQAINDYHSHTGPILSSWRDLVDLVFLALIMIMIFYLLLYRAGFNPCDKALSFLFRPVIIRLLEQQQHQEIRQQQQTPTLPTITSRTTIQNRTPSTTIFGAH